MSPAPSPALQPPPYAAYSPSPGPSPPPRELQRPCQDALLLSTPAVAFQACMQCWNASMCADARCAVHSAGLATSCVVAKPSCGAFSTGVPCLLLLALDQVPCQPLCKPTCKLELLQAKPQLCSFQGLQLQGTKAPELLQPSSPPPVVSPTPAASPVRLAASCAAHARHLPAEQQPDVL